MNITGLNSAPSAPVDRSSYYEFASHILIPLSIVKQRCSPAPPPQRATANPAISFAPPALQQQPLIIPNRDAIRKWGARHSALFSPLPPPHQPPTVPARLAPCRLMRPATRSSAKTSWGAAYYTERCRTPQGGRITLPAAPIPQIRRGTWLPRSPDHAPSRNRTENLLIKSQLL